MDTSDPKIVFNQSGVCSHCVNFETHTLPRWSKLQSDYVPETYAQNLKKRNSSNSEFDCLIGLSGGLDSSYALYYAVQVLGLNPLVFHVDAGWNSDIAVHNINVLVNALDVELHTEVIKWSEMRDLQIAYFKAGVSNIDAPQDHAFFATMYQFANRYKIKNILTGGNYSTEAIRNPVNWMYFQSDGRNLQAIHQAHGSIPLSSYPITNALWHKVYLPWVKGVRVFRPLDNIKDFEKKKAELTLHQFCGWKPYKQKHFESLFTRFYESYWLPTRYQWDVRKVQFSSLILTGQMSREEALRLLKESPYSYSGFSKDFETVCRKLKIGRDELNALMELPKVSNNKFKSLKFFYGVGSSVYRAVGAEDGGK